MLATLGKKQGRKKTGGKALPARLAAKKKGSIMRTPLAMLAASAFLTACGTPEQIAYQQDPVMAMSEEYGPPCEKTGYAKGTEQWRNCIVQTSRRDDLTKHALHYDRYMQWYWTGR
jgi:hypothetical protein